MRVEAIVKNGGLFIPNPGFPLAAKGHITLEINVIEEEKSDPYLQAAGILKEKQVDGVAFQKKLRKEWEQR